MYKLMNSAMMPAPGNYALRQVDSAAFSDLLRTEKFSSFIGYQDTADFLERISGVKVPVSREPTTVEDGDTLLIVKLKYRVQNPGDKSRFVPADSDYEFFVCGYRSK